MAVTYAAIIDTIRNGSLGPFALGTSRQLVGETLGEPADATITNRRRTSCVWRYGSIEFHFENDLLSLVHSDADSLFYGGPSLLVDPWKLRPRMSLAELKTILNAVDLRYTGCGNQYAADCLMRFDSGFTIGFVADPNSGLGVTGLCSWSIQKGK
ncbi:hypothetical protein SH528x_002996 [Novipirellula sp. SH528]|uniref:hypothetical protein n=1 Tax=Novipirellula sp. SH528 TaxID=3454466 RepID=UPI003F9FE56D